MRRLLLAGYQFMAVCAEILVATISASAQTPRLDAFTAEESKAAIIEYYITTHAPGASTENIVYASDVPMLWDGANILDEPLLYKVLNPNLTASSIDTNFSASFIPIYRYILDWAAPARFEYTARQRCLIAGLEQFFTRNTGNTISKTPVLAHYQEQRRSYAAALDALLKEAKAAGGIKAVTITELLDTHFLFVTVGQKLAVETRLTELRKLWSLDPNVRWADYRNQFGDNSFAAGPDVQPLSTTQPTLRDANSTAIWHSTAIRGGQLDVTEITIVRPWLAEAVFNSERWGWAPGSPLGAGFVISDGHGLAQPVSGRRLQVIPTQLFLARVSSAGSTDFTHSPLFLLGYEVTAVPTTPSLMAEPVASPPIAYSSRHPCLTRSNKLPSKKR